jgi:hypothetical protein
VTELGRALFVVLACACLAPMALAAQEAAPTFRAGADLVTIDVQIVPVRGTSVPVLTADLFDVRIAGQKRTVVSAVFVHYDEGAIVRPSSAQGIDPAALATCVFRHLRTADAVHAHYRLAIETREADRKKVSKVRVKVSDKTVSLRGWAWRSATGQ